MKRKNILLKTAIGVGTAAAVTTAAVATTSCSKATSYIQAHSISSLIAGSQSTATIKVEARNVTLPSNKVVETQNLPDDINAIWQPNGYIKLSGNHPTAETIEFTISVGDVSTTTSIDVVNYTPGSTDHIEHETLVQDKLYLDESYSSDLFHQNVPVDGCWRYIYGEEEDSGEDWLVEYGIIDLGKITIHMVVSLDLNIYMMINKTMTSSYMVIVNLNLV